MQRSTNTGAMMVRVYRGLLRLYPVRFRRTFGAEMAQLFDDQCRDARANSETLAFPQFIARTIWDLLRTLPIEHLGALREFLRMKPVMMSFVRAAALGAAVFLVVLGLVVAALMSVPREYRGVARVVVDRSSPNQEGALTDPFFLQTQVAILTSNSLLEKVIQELNLSGRWSSGKAMSRAETLERFRRELHVRQYRNTSLIEIGVVDRDPAVAAAIANELSLAIQRGTGPAERTVGDGVVRIIDPAESSLRPIRPNLPLWIVLGILGAGLAALATTGGTWWAASRR